MPPSADWFAETRLRPPLAQSGSIERAVLPALVAGVLSHRVTLLSAPAGYGKTSLLAALARTSGLSVAWYSIDAEDRDPGRLLAGIELAVDLAIGAGASAGVVAGTVAMAEGPVASHASRPGAALLDRVGHLAPDPFVLVLDDLHLVESAEAHELLAWIIEHMPSRLHLVMAARFDPPLRLARLRAARELYELRPVDLRMTPDEARRVLAGTIGRQLPTPDLDRLGAPAEGWPAGLVLLGTAATRALDSGQGTVGPRERRLVFDFLAEEVLALQEPDVRRFLLETSILTELSPSRCDLVTERPGSRSMLELLLHRNLFLVELEARGADEPVCRHHTLFAEFLRGQLRRELPDLVPVLHRRAASAETQPSRAIDHWLAAEAWDRAATAIEPVADGLIMRGQLGRLLDWLAALPDRAYRSHPRLVYARAVGMIQQGNPAGVAEMLETALADARRTADVAMEVDVRSAQAALALWHADFAACTALLDLAAQPSRRPATDVLTSMLRASVALFADFDHRAAAEALRQALASPAAAEDPEAMLYVALLLGPEFTVLPGALDAVEAFCGRASRLPEAVTGPIGLGVDDVMAPIHLCRGRLEEAVTTARRAVARRGELGGYLFLGLNADLAGGMARAARGEYAEARAMFDRLRASAGQTPLNRAIGADGRFATARLAWIEGHSGETRAMLAQLEAETLPAAPFGVVLRLLLRAMVEISQGDHEAAERTLHEAADRESSAPIATVYASAEALLARLHWIRRRPRAALGALSPLIRACADAGTPGRILQEGPLLRPILRHAVAVGTVPEEAARLLAMLDEGRDAAARESSRAEAAQPLSERELEVVRRIADGASNADIAESLGISLATVKSHVGHAMDKLDASSRTQLVARARRAGLID